MIQTKNNKAFTLVELIVVIVILAILATIAFLSFSSQSGSARDSTRLSDISSIKKSVEMYNVNAGTYPSPDKPFSYTYSGGIIWNQGTIGDSAYKMLQKNLSKKVVDPLKGSEYDYSLASNKREYQVAGNFENPTSFERNYNPFDSSVLSPQLSALGGTGVNVYISGNYNGVMLKVFTGSTYYFVPTPTLFGIGTGSTVYDNTFGSGKDLLPGVNNVAVFDSSKVYATGSDNLGSADITNLMTTVKAAYSTGNVTTPAVQAIVSASGAELINLGEGLVKNSLGGSTTTSSGDTQGGYTAPTVGLVGYWDMETLNGGKLKDLSGNGNDGTINGALVSTGKVGNAYSFNGSSDYVQLVNKPSLALLNDFTITSWINSRNLPSTTFPTQYDVIYDGYDGTNQGIGFGIGEGGKLGFGDGLGLHNLWTTGIVVNNTSTWYLVVATFNKSSKIGTVYVNGSVVAQNSNLLLSTNDTGVNPRIGRSTYAGSYYFFDGKLDEIRIYDRALSSQEILDYYNATK